MRTHVENKQWHELARHRGRQLMPYFPGFEARQQPVSQNRNKMKRIILCLMVAVLAMASATQAQQPLTPTQYSNVRGVLNPAATLIHQGGEIATLGRRQWVGIEGAPTVLWGSGYAGFSSLGATAGINIRHESLAVEKLTEASAFFAKAVRISEHEYVGLSLNAGITHLNGKFSQLDPADPAFRDDVIETDALVGFGVVLYRPDRYYVGLSMPRLMLGNLGVDEDNRYNFRNQYHVVAGALFGLGGSGTFHLRPALLATYAENLRPQFEVSAMVFASRMIGVGLNARNHGELAGMLQFNIAGLGLSYAYQFNPKHEAMNQRIENTTHEIGLSYRFNSPVRSLL